MSSLPQNRFIRIYFNEYVHYGPHKDMCASTRIHTHTHTHTHKHTRSRNLAMFPTVGEILSICHGCCAEAWDMCGGSGGETLRLGHLPARLRCLQCVVLLCLTTWRGEELLLMDSAGKPPCFLVQSSTWLDLTDSTEWSLVTELWNLQCLCFVDTGCAALPDSGISWNTAAHCEEIWVESYCLQWKASDTLNAL